MQISNRTEILLPSYKYQKRSKVMQLPVWKLQSFCFSDNLQNYSKAEPNLRYCLSEFCSCFKTVQNTQHILWTIPIVIIMVFYLTLQSHVTVGKELRDYVIVKGFNRYMSTQSKDDIVTHNLTVYVLLCVARSTVCLWHALTVVFVNITTLTLCTRKLFTRHGLLTQKLSLSVWGQSDKRCLASPRACQPSDFLRQCVNKLEKFI